MLSARRLRAWSIAALLALGLSRLLVPAAPLPVPADPARDVWAGALHVHTTRSDGSGSPAEVAAAAARAGLQFVILTDHGDGTGDVSAPAYMSGVLVIDGVEVSTREGHYLAFGMARSPYPLAGDARDVAEDVARLGGIGLVAHPDSARSALAWHAPDVGGDGIEILNADSAWRDEGVIGLLTRLVPYPWRPSAVLATTLTYPSTLLADLDRPDLAAPRLAVAGVDAHARIGLRPRQDPADATRTLARWPGYTASFGTFGMVVPWARGRAPTGDAHIDARAVLDAFRTHMAHIAVFALAEPAHLGFTAVVEGAVHGPGARLPGRPPVTLVVEAPRLPTATVRLLRNGVPWREAAPGDRLVARVAGGMPAVYRAEAWLPRRWRQPALPWLVSQAIAVDGTDAAVAGRSARESAAFTPIVGPWRAEHDPCSALAITDLEGAATVVAASLCAGARVSQFAAAVIDWPAAPHAETLSFVGSAEQPMRVSVQLREPTAGDGLRWARSVYLDGTPRAFSVPLADFRPIPPASGLPPTDRLHALLFVTDTENTPPGARRTFRIASLGVR